MTRTPTSDDAPTTAAPTFGFDHLDQMSDHRGLFEHADGTTPRKEHGYCTDDNARLLVVTSRAPDAGCGYRLSRLALRFLLDGQALDGRCRNRMDRDGRWTDKPGTDDCWGRSIWGLGTAAALHTDPVVRQRAQRGFDLAVRHRSRWPRALAFAALGAAEVVAVMPRHGPARSVLDDVLAAIGPVADGTSWAWPEPRLAYANAALAEAVIAAGAALERPADLERGLAMLAWLLAGETRDGHLSVTGVGGRGVDDVGPHFDQQPIEVAALADACWRAHAVTGDPVWARGVAAAADWFLGSNDAGTAVFDPMSGGGYDGLRADGVNLNEGAESTLALVSTMQRAQSFAPAT